MLAGGIRRMAFKWNVIENDDLLKENMWENEVHFEVLQRFAVSDVNNIDQLVLLLQLNPAGLSFPVLILEYNGFTCVFYRRAKGCITSTQLYVSHVISI